MTVMIKEYAKRLEAVRRGFKIQCQRRGKDISFKDFCSVLDDNQSTTTTTKHLTFAANLTKSRAYILYYNLYSDKKRVADA